MRSILKTAAGLLLSLTLLVPLIACAKTDEQGSKFGEDIPAEVADFIVEYYEAFKKSEGDARPYRYYISEEIKERTYANSPDYKVLEYEIKDGEKLSDNLYAFKISVLMDTMPQEKIDNRDFYSYYNFVAKIDGKWLICPGKADIPADMKEGFDLDRFQNDGTVIGTTEDGRDLVDGQNEKF